MHQRRASHEAEGWRGARGGGAGRVRAPAGRRLCLLCQIGDELVAGVEQFLLVDDVVAVEDGPALVAGQEYGDPLGDIRADQVARGGAPAVILPLDNWSTDFDLLCKNLRNRIESLPFNKVFDLIQFVLRHPRCPRGFVTEMRSTFSDSHLAYTIDVGPPPTIVPAPTPEEGVAVVESLQSLRQAGLDGSAAHLRKASECINEGDWPGSVRESIHAVESVARQLDPEAAQTLGPALKSIERRGALHPALKKAFDTLYGYTNNEQGIRHALLDQTDTKVGLDEAVFMLGACASFASYLWRKHVAGEPS